MDRAKVDYKCVACDLQAMGLSELHKHQTINHTSEELSFGILTLQSFIYHKHYFQKFDEIQIPNICHFYPFCTQWFNGKNRIKTEDSEQPDVKKQLATLEGKISVKPLNRVCQKQAKLQLGSNKNKVSLKSSNSLLKVTQDPQSDITFFTRINSLCKDLGKFNDKSKKCKRLNETRDRCHLVKNNKETISKPSAEPMIDEKSTTVQLQDPVNDHLETIKIWASSSKDSFNIMDIPSGMTMMENEEGQVRFNSSTVSDDIINCQNALIYNSESGTLQWNPLFYVDQTNDEITRKSQGDSFALQNS